MVLACNKSMVLKKLSKSSCHYLDTGGEAMEHTRNLAYLSDGKEAGGKRERIASNEMCGSVK